MCNAHTQFAKSKPKQIKPSVTIFCVIHCPPPQKKQKAESDAVLGFSSLLLFALQLLTVLLGSNRWCMGK